MPRIVQHAIAADEVRKGDLYNDTTVCTIKRGPVRITFFDSEDQQFAYLRRTDVVRIQRVEPTAQELLEKELEYCEALMNAHDEHVLKARQFDALTVFQQELTDRKNNQWTWSSSFQLEGFIKRQAEAEFWAGLPLSEEFEDKPERPAQTTTDRLVCLVELLEHLRKRYLDRSPTNSSSQVSNLMDQARAEAHREAITGYFNSGLLPFEYHLKKVRELEQDVVYDESLVNA